MLELHDPLAALDLGIRLAIVGQYTIVIGAVLLAMRNRFGLWLLMISLGLLAYLLVASPTLESLAPALVPPAHLLAGSMSWIFWYFIREGFELPLNSTWVWLSWLLLMLPKWVLFMWFATDLAVLQAWLRDLKQIVAIVLTVHALWHLLTSYSDDLVEKRRTLRKALAICTGATMLGIQAVELMLGYDTSAPALNLLASATIFLLTLVFAPPILAFNKELFPAHPHPAGPATVDSARSVAQQQLHTDLHQLMEQGAYRDSALTIGKLAAQLGLPEHQLRKLINAELGYRNFSTFVQHYRVAEVCRHLRAPDKARIPILTLALDAGFGSLGPFNRAFKSITGLTPSEYRDRPPPDSENP